MKISVENPTAKQTCKKSFIKLSQLWRMSDEIDCFVLGGSFGSSVDVEIKKDILFGTLITKNVRTNILWDEKISEKFSVRT